MSDFFWFSDAQWARIEPLLPTDVRGKKRMAMSVAGWPLTTGSALERSGPKDRPVESGTADHQ